MPELYISTDVETDGPIPGPHSMLSFASAAFTADKRMLGTFSANLRTLEGAAGEAKTMEWWKTQPRAWEACRRDVQDPAAAMTIYVNWIKSLGGKPVFVAYPAGFDFLFVYWYLIRFTGASPFSHLALDIKTFAIKRLYVRPPFRRHGIAKSLLSHLESCAKARGYAEVVLETGDVLHGAIALYERAGYGRCEAFGAYSRMLPQAIERSLFFAKRIGSGILDAI